MLGGSRKLLIIAIFTALLIVLVNLAWWVFYQRTEQLLDNQLSRRLTAIARTTSIALPVETVRGLLEGNLNSYDEANSLLSQARAADSLSEVFVLAGDYSYLATTGAETDSLYFLAELNGPYIDSILFGLVDGPLATPSYQTGSVYLKSAFAPLRDERGVTVAVLGVEANVDYFASLADLKSNLYYSTALSVVGGLIFGTLFLLVQRRLNQAQQRLFVNETHAYLGRMVAVVAHEVRNPLMIIRASAERLKKKHGAAEGDFIVDEVDRLDRLVTGYLDVARGGAGESLLQSERPQTIRLRQLTADLQKHFADKYAEHRVEWISAPVPDDLEIESYTGPLGQVLLNLLINGAEACLSAARPIAVGLDAADSGEFVTLTVSDRGPGMSRRDLKRAGDPFYSTKLTGSGLGLYLSWKIVDEMGGRLDISTRPGTGTRAVVTLPKRPKD